MFSLQIDCPPTYRGSNITWCGEAPGQDECWLKRGFVGKAGKVAEVICSFGGLDFGAVNLTNVAKRRPSDNNLGEFYLDKKCTKPTPELEAWRDELRRELLYNKAKVVVACGN